MERFVDGCRNFFGIITALALLVALAPVLLVVGGACWFIYPFTAGLCDAFETNPESRQIKTGRGWVIAISGLVGGPLCFFAGCWLFW